MTRTRIISDIDIIPDRAAGYERGPSGVLQNQAWVGSRLESNRGREPVLDRARSRHVGTWRSAAIAC